MIKLENTTVYGWEEAIRGMRNPLNSWEKSDSGKGCFCRKGWDGEIEKRALECEDCDATKDSYCICTSVDGKHYVLGENDYILMVKLRNAGTDHRKFMRMLTTYVDITAPLYWWKEFDTYKVGTVANSCSTMHTIYKKEFTLDDFSCEHILDETFTAEVIPKVILEATIKCLNENRAHYLSTKDKKYWWQMIQLLPTSYNQKRTVMLNYEVLANIYKSRKNHKLDEWHEFCCWIIHSLPYSSLITCDDWLYLAFEEAKKIDPRIAKVEMEEDTELNHVNFIFRDKDGYILYIPNIPNGQDDPIEYLKASVKECVEFQTIDKGEWHEV